MTFDNRTTATILAALRLYQREGFTDPGQRPDWLEEIASDGNSFAALTETEIDTLCESINAPTDPIYLAIVIEGGMVQDIVSNHPNAFAFVDDVMVIDYDDDSADPDDLTIVPQEDGTEADALCHSSSISTAAIGLAAVSAALSAKD